MSLSYGFQIPCSLMIHQKYQLKPQPGMPMDIISIVTQQFYYCHTRYIKPNFLFACLLVNKQCHNTLNKAQGDGTIISYKSNLIYLSGSEEKKLNLPSFFTSAWYLNNNLRVQIQQKCGGNDVKLKCYNNFHEGIKTL